MKTMDKNPEKNCQDFLEIGRIFSEKWDLRSYSNFIPIEPKKFEFWNLNLAIKI